MAVWMGKEELDYREIRGDLCRNSPFVPTSLGCARVTTNPEPPCHGSEGLRVVQTYVQHSGHRESVPLQHALSIWGTWVS